MQRKSLFSYNDKVIKENPTSINVGNNFLLFNHRKSCGKCEKSYKVYSARKAHRV